jgi:hypothetical protein
VRPLTTNIRWETVLWESLTYLKLPKCLWKGKPGRPSCPSIHNDKRSMNRTSVNCLSKKKDRFRDLDRCAAPPKHNYFKPVRGNHNVVDRTPFRIVRIPTFDGIRTASTKDTSAMVVTVQSVHIGDIFQNPYPSSN